MCVVSVLPRIVPFHFDVPIFAGQATQVTCLVSEGDPPLDITWSFQGTELSSQMGISTAKFGRKTSLLVIDPASSGHRGNYTCTVRNPAGYVNYTASLDVHGTVIVFSVGYDTLRVLIQLPHPHFHASVIVFLTKEM